MEQEGPAAAPGAGKLSKSQKRRLQRQLAAAKAAAGEVVAEAAAERGAANVAPSDTGQRPRGSTRTGHRATLRQSQQNG